MGDIHADVVASAETIAARINELYQAILIVGNIGATPELTAAEAALGERMQALEAAYASQATVLPTPAFTIIPFAGQATPFANAASTEYVPAHHWQATMGSGGLICRNCGNTGRDMLGNPCPCGMR